MKKMIKYLGVLLFIACVFPELALAGGLQSVRSIGLDILKEVQFWAALALVGALIGGGVGICFGNEDAKRLIKNTVIGSVIASCAAIIITWFFKQAGNSINLG